MPTPGDVDIVIASELMEAGRAIQRGLVTPDRTTLIASTNRTFSMTEKLAMADGRVDDEKLIEACRNAARQFYAFDMAALAEATGSVISAVLFGALAGANVLPFQRMAFEAAIRRGGVGVSTSLAAFTAGFEAARRDEAPSPLAAAPKTIEAPRLPQAVSAVLSDAERVFPAPVQTVVRAGVLRSADYQNAAYARLYLDRLAPVVAVEQKHGDGTHRLLQETARQLALGMTYEDTIRVAELKIRPSRFARVREEVKIADGQILEIAEFMHPRTQEIADTLPAPVGRFILRTAWVRGLIDKFTSSGRRVKTTSLRGFLLLYMVAAFKPLRPRSLRYEVEQEALQQWLATIGRVAETDYDLAAEIAACRNLVKGYGDTHERGRARFDALMGTLPELAGRADAAGQLAGLHKAANGDDSGAALAAALSALRADRAAAVKL
jgi:indolepyruvate ferredoxin oxidoreductase beta subunit